MKSKIAALLIGGLAFWISSLIPFIGGLWLIRAGLSVILAIIVFTKLSELEREWDLKKELRDFEKANKLYPSRAAAAYYERGQYHSKRHSVEKAIKDFTEAIRLGDSELNYKFYLKRGMAYYISNLDDEAIADFSQSVELNPSCEDAYLERGKIYAGRKKDYDAAIKDYNRIIELNPHNSDAKYQMEKIEQSKRWAANAAHRRNGSAAKSGSAADYQQTAAAEDVWESSTLSDYYESSGTSYDSGSSETSYDSGYSDTSYDSGSSDTSSGSDY